MNVSRSRIPTVSHSSWDLDGLGPRKLPAAALQASAGDRSGESIVATGRCW